MEAIENDNAGGGNSYIKMDYSLETPEERNEKVKEIIANTPPERLTPAYLEKLADYIVFSMDKKGSQKRDVITSNHLETVNKRETSFEGLVGKLENGEDGIYNMITNDKNVIFQPKAPITAEDLAEIPGLSQLHEEIVKVEEECKHARGKRAYALRKQLIGMRQDQYVLKAAYKKPIHCMNLIKSIPKLDLSEEVYLDDDDKVQSTGLINLYNEKMVSALLTNYSKIKEDAWEKVNEDAKWLMEDLDTLIENALREDYPYYYQLLIYKIDGVTNAEIQLLLEQEFGVSHTPEYISCLWRNKIPKLIVEEAKREWIIWHFTFEEKGVWKKCGRCGRIMPAHNMFYSRNKGSKDGCYSICKDCRNNKNKKKDGEK